MDILCIELIIFSSRSHFITTRLHKQRLIACRFVIISSFQPRVSEVLHAVPQRAGSISFTTCMCCHVSRVEPLNPSVGLISVWHEHRVTTLIWSLCGIKAGQIPARGHQLWKFEWRQLLLNILKFKKNK